ncbi:MAG TPA: beta-Ala-His dipeptidase, partial [Polyangia bacterium]|nr:beta-Ala-His dipeptidase [Polyangia bacterium]
MPSPIENLKPEAVWNYFGRICQIPHGSGNERALGEAVMAWAKERGVVAERDEVGNVIVRIPATKGCEQAPAVVLQGHLDMVCEKNSDRVFDFEKDPIELVRDGDWLAADGTTLGADNGVGLAMGLAFLDGAAVHGPLEVLCTVSEETGLDGARALKPGFVKGRLLINLDSEEDGVFYVGCAGGRDCHISLPVARAAVPADHIALDLELKGLRGGHSGLDIVHNRGNATRLLARAILAASRRAAIAIGAIEGGDKHNAIPREARALLALPREKWDEATALLKKDLSDFRSEFSRDAGLSISFEKTEAPNGVFAPESQHAALDMLLAFPNGVIAMSRDLPGLVETSN